MLNIIYRDRKTNTTLGEKTKVTELTERIAKWNSPGILTKGNVKIVN